MDGVEDKNLIPARRAKGVKVFEEIKTIDFYDIVIPLSINGITLPHSRIGRYQGKIFEIHNLNNFLEPTFNEIQRGYQHSTNLMEYWLIFDNYENNKYSFVLKSILQPYDSGEPIEEIVHDEVIITFFDEVQEKIRKQEVEVYLQNGMVAL